MTEAGALAITGGLLLVVALVCAVIAEDNYSPGASFFGWLFLVAGVVSLAGSAWWAVP
jgi:hypothetical protein